MTRLGSKYTSDASNVICHAYSLIAETKIFGQNGLTKKYITER